MRKNITKMLNFGKYCVTIMVEKGTRNSHNNQKNEYFKPVNKINKEVKRVNEDVKMDEMILSAKNEKKVGEEVFEANNAESNFNKKCYNNWNVEEKVEDFIKDYNVNVSSVIDIVALARQIGFDVFTIGLDSSTDGFIAIDEEDDNLFDTGSNKIIGINKNISIEDQRFTIAHELAHYYLEGREKSFFAHRENKKGKDDRENCMDYFAACLLMHHKPFKAIHNALKDFVPQEEIISLLAKKFKVTEESAKRRISELL